uniref:G-protein coupled receptors family 1 profile domain-containing protein n=1 Tax=Ditylenchus dipsaci TaxID=166011 RepID=A0A915E464_9BILA
MYVSNETNKTNVVQKTVFIQALLICSANACTAALFFCMALFDMSNYILYVSTYVWCMAHGIPSVIYIFLNKTIRRSLVDPSSGAHTNTVERLWRSSKKRNKNQSGTARHHLVSYLEEFWWRNRAKEKDPFEELLKDIAELYPPNLPFNIPR